ncbi:MAG TPA: hypothetical protein VE989_00005, partial [Sphingomicrobium sp.]|nr:hypothetical protein [Sphingomicrobium sp.]
EALGIIVDIPEPRDAVDHPWGLCRLNHHERRLTRPRGLREELMGDAIGTLSNARAVEELEERIITLEAKQI